MRGCLTPLHEQALLRIKAPCINAPESDWKLIEGWSIYEAFFGEILRFLHFKQGRPV